MGRLEDWPKALEGIVKGGRRGSRARKNVAGLGLSTQTTSFVGSFLCPGKIGQVESSEGPGMPQALGSVASPNLNLVSLWPGLCLGSKEKGGKGRGYISSLGGVLGRIERVG